MCWVCANPEPFSFYCTTLPPTMAPQQWDSCLQSAAYPARKSGRGGMDPETVSSLWPWPSGTSVRSTDTAARLQGSQPGPSFTSYVIQDKLLNLCWLPTPQKDDQNNLLIKQSQACCSLQREERKPHRLMSEEKRRMWDIYEVRMVWFKVDLSN